MVYTLMFEWYVVMFASRNEHQKYVFLQWMRLCAHNDGNRSRLSSQHYVGNMYDHITSMRISTLTVDKLFLRAAKIRTQMTPNTIGVASSSSLTKLMACGFISYKK